MLFHQPGHYRGKIPIELYVELQNKFPQADGESDSAWLHKIQRDPMLARKMFGTRQFQVELIQAVRRRAAIATMANAGATRQGKDWKSWAPAQRYQADALREFQKSGKDQAAYAKEAYELLLEQFDAATPASGSVFWNGINELALMKKIDKWNEDAEVFGQLEATTAARYVNKQFVWETGGAFERYFTTVSGMLGHAATLRAATGSLASETVRQLSEGVLRMMMLTKLKAGLAVACVGLFLLGGLGLGMLPPQSALAQSAPTTKPAPVPDAAKPGVDTLNDPLPDGAIARLGTSRLRGKRLTFSPDSKKVVREIPGGDLQLFEVPSGKFLAKIRAADVPERTFIVGSTIAFSPDSKLLAAVLWEGRTGIWDSATGKLIRWIESGAFYSIVQCDFSTDGKLLAVGGSDPANENDTEKNRVGVYEVGTGKQLFAEQGSSSQFTEDGKRLFLWEGYRGEKGKFRTVSIADPDQRTVGDLNTHVPNSDDPRTDGKSAVAELLKNGDVRIRDMDSGEIKLTLAGAVRGENGGVNLRRASGRRELIVTQAEPPALWCWNIDTGKQLWKRDVPAPPYWADLSKNGKRLVTSGKAGEVVTIDALTGKDIATIAVRTVGHSSSAAKIAPDGRVVATFTASPEPGGGTVVFWDAGTGKLLTDLPGHSAQILDAVFTPDGSKIITAGRDDTLRTWDPASGRDVSKVPLAAPSQLAQAPDGRRLYASDAKSGTIRVVDPATGKVAATFAAFKKSIVGFALTADGQRLIVAGRDAEEAGIIRTVNAATGEQIREFDTGEYRVEQMAASADGALIATACAGRKLIVWDRDGKRLSEHDGIGKRGPSWIEKPPHYLMGSVAVTPDGRSIAFSDQEAGVGIIDGGSKKLSGHAKQVGVYFQDRAARYDVRDVLAIAPDGKTIAWSGIESTADVYLIELRTQTVRRKLPGDSYPVKRLAFSPDGSQLLSTGPDGSALVWDLYGRHAAKPTAAANEKDIAGWWEALDAPDAATAEPALRAMVAHSAEALKLLREKIPGAVVDPATIDAWIAKLGDGDFVTREAASRALSLIASADKKLEAAAAKSDSAEVRERADTILKKLRRVAGVREARAVEALTRIGTPEAKSLLATLAKGPPDARLTRDAAEAFGQFK